MPPAMRQRDLKVKFRTIIIFFNLILVIFLVILCLVPFFILGPEFPAAFRHTNRFLVLMLAVILAAFDGYFIANRKLYALLEKEDWPALVHYLEDRVIRQGKFSPGLVRLLANTYLVLSDSPSVMSLENKAAIAKPSLVESNVLVFGTARILGRDINGAVHFFGSRVDSAKPALRQWVIWYYAFSLLLDKQYDRAADTFSTLAKNSPDALVTGMASFFLGDALARALPGRTAGLDKAAAEGRDRVRKVLRALKDWAREASALSTEIHAAALAKYFDEAGAWLYDRPGGARERQDDSYTKSKEQV
jgi:hypothetical protein